jgi:predicted HAD superfamily Cof-like phosphohydrolase
VNKEQLAVKEFHELIGAPTPLRPMLPNSDRLALRLELIREELNELADAFNFCRDCEAWHPDGRPSDTSLIEAADALGDLLVVVYGAGLELGIDLEPVFAEIHRSNMTKGGGPVRADGKALKGPNFTPPNLLPIIQRQMARDEWDDYPENWPEPVTHGVRMHVKSSYYWDGEVYRRDFLPVQPGPDQGLVSSLHFDPPRKVSFIVHSDPGDETNHG